MWDMSRRQDWFESSSARSLTARHPADQSPFTNRSNGSRSALLRARKRDTVEDASPPCRAIASSTELERPSCIAPDLRPAPRP